MEKLGYGAEMRLAVTVSARNTPEYRDPAVILIGQLREIYIDGQLDPVDTAIWFPKVMRRDYAVGPTQTATANHYRGIAKADTARQQACGEILRLPFRYQCGGMEAGHQQCRAARERDSSRTDALNGPRLGFIYARRVGLADLWELPQPPYRDPEKSSGG